MGSGVGLPNRVAYKITAGRSFIEFKYLSKHFDNSFEEYIKNRDEQVT